MYSIIIADTHTGQVSAVVPGCCRCGWELDHAREKTEQSYGHQLHQLAHGQGMVHALISKGSCHMHIHACGPA